MFRRVASDTKSSGRVTPAFFNQSLRLFFEDLYDDTPYLEFEDQQLIGLMCSGCSNVEACRVLGLQDHRIYRVREKLLANGGQAYLDRLDAVPIELKRMWRYDGPPKYKL